MRMFLFSGFSEAPGNLVCWVGGDVGMTRTETENGDRDSKDGGGERLLLYQTREVGTVYQGTFRVPQPYFPRQICATPCPVSINTRACWDTWACISIPKIYQVPWIQPVRDSTGEPCPGLENRPGESEEQLDLEAPKLGEDKKVS